MALVVERIGPDRLEATLDDVASLRIRVFRDYPYLYDGDRAYERRYLESYRTSAGAIVVGAWDGDALVGAATGTPMEDHADEFGAPFVAAGFDLADMFYCAESVLLAGYRGQGAGHAFFDLREAHARTLGRRWSCFCSVVRGAEGRPPDYRPLDGFWRKRGYAPMPGVFARFKWKDVGQDVQTEKSLQFWIRALDERSGGGRPRP